jgi:hypothetical protein
MTLSVHQPQYLPWLGYFDKIAKSDCFVFLDEVQYKPREFQNRNKIKTKDGWIWLSIPVKSKGKGRQKICDIKIDNNFSWQNQHKGSLKTWYGHAPFFRDYFPFFEQIFERKWEKLVDLNVYIIEYVLKQLAITRPIYFESALDIRNTKTDRIIEICQKLKADTYLSGIGGREYLEEEKFSQAGLKLLYQDFHHPVYKQQFMKSETDFLPYMSIVDLLFNAGKRATGFSNAGLECVEKELR